MRALASPRTGAENGDKNRRVLMLVNGFPPARQYILRSVEFAKYLPDFGWAPLVLTPRHRREPGCEQSMAVPPGVAVTRTLRLPSLADVAAAVRGTARNSRKVESAQARPAVAARVPVTMGTMVRQALLLCDTPDPYAGWIPFAVAAGSWIAWREQVAAVHASGPPFSVVCAGAILSRLTGLPLVADFRDAWTLDASDPFGTLSGEFRARSMAKIRWLRGLERWVLGSSGAVLFTSRATQALYAAEYPGVEAKSHVIYNGADSDDFVGEAPDLARPTVAHIGTVHEYQWNQVETFLRGFARALRSGSVPLRTQLILAGAMGVKLRDRLEATVRDLGIDGAVHLPGFVAHAQAVRWMRGSRLLLMFAGENPYIRLSKISEYVAAGSPMLAFAPERSETAEDVRRYGGRVLSECSEEIVETELARACWTTTSRRPPCVIDDPHPLNRRTEARQLAGILDALHGAGGACLRRALPGLASRR